MAPVVHSPPSELIQATPSPNPPFPPEPQPALEGKQVVETPLGPRHANLRPQGVLAEPLANMQLPLRSQFPLQKNGGGGGGWIQSSLWPVTLRGEGLEPWRILLPAQPPPPPHFTDEETEPREGDLPLSSSR
uniref:Uncharacterized protein n=1 Tax=Myotis myotis TaxID=51298 RepID=A0A7J7Z5G2_MYOMY|nr:hypothetical protein mMyoMyo1_010779 [Myotis myotis]